MTQWVHNLDPGIPSKASNIIPVCVVLTVVATVATLLRCYVRMNMLKVFGADDWVIVASTVSPSHAIRIFGYSASKLLGLTWCLDLQHSLQCTGY